MNSKAQAATEYLMIVGFVFMIILPLVYLVYNYTQESSGEISIAQINKIGRDMINSAESVYYFSRPSKVTLDVNMPESVLNLTIVTNDPSEGCTKCSELRFLVQSGQYKNLLVFSSKIRLQGENFVDSDGNTVTFDKDGAIVSTYPLYSVYDRTSFSQGIKHFKIEARQDHVLITTT